MGRSRESLLHSASTVLQEDRLTEILATVLDASDELAAALFDEVGLPVGERFQVFTQVRVTKTDRPDMLVHSLEPGGTVVSRIWSEHKVRYGFGDMQRERYLKALRDLSGDGKLIFVVADAPTAREEGDWRGFTWQENWRARRRSRTCLGRARVAQACPRTGSADEVAAVVGAALVLGGEGGPGGGGTRTRLRARVGVQANGANGRRTRSSA